MEEWRGCCATFTIWAITVLTQPLNSSEQDTRANLEFSSNFDIFMEKQYKIKLKSCSKWKYFHTGRDLIKNAFRDYKTFYLDGKVQEGRVTIKAIVSVIT